MVFWTALAVSLVIAWSATAGAWRLAHTRAWLVRGERAGQGWGLPPATLTALAGLLAGLSVLLFLMFARSWDGGLPGRVDRVAADLARAAWSPRAQPMVLAVTHLADPLTLWAAAVGVGAWLAWRREPALLVAWASALGGNALLNPALKRIYERWRPPADLSGLVAPGYSFPSGHTSGAVVLFGMLAYLAWRLLPPRWHLPCWLAAVTLVMMVGASRVWLQAHWLSDVLAGMASGGAWLALCIAASGVWRARATPPSPR